MVSVVWTIRRALADESLSSQSCLWAQVNYLNPQSYVSIDPYFLLPALTASLYYFNMGRGITPENKDQIISRIKAGCQILCILWLPILVNWPIVVFIFNRESLCIFFTMACLLFVKEF